MPKGKDVLRLLFFIIVSIFLSKASASVPLSEDEQRFLQTHPVITLGTDANWSPHIILNQDGSLIGYDPDILNLINKYTGANFQLVAGDWKDMVAKVKAKEIDGLSTSPALEEREVYLNYSEPYTSYAKALIVANNNPKNIYSIDDLPGKKIGYQKGCLFDVGILRRFENSTLVPFDSASGVAESLITGKIDATIGSNTLYYTNKQHYGSMKTVDLFPESSVKLVFGVSKDYPEAISILNKGLKALTDEEKITLRNKWFSEPALNSHDQLGLTAEERGWLLDHPVIRVGEGQGREPLLMASGDGSYVGIVPELFDYIAGELGVTFKYVEDQWPSLLERMQNREIDLVASINRRVAEEKGFIAVDAPFSPVTTVFARKTRTFEVEDDTDIGGLRIAYHGEIFFLDKYLKDKGDVVTLLPTPNSFEALKKVMDGEADIAIGLNSDSYLITKYLMYEIEPIYYFQNLDVESSLGVRSDSVLLASIMSKAINNLSLAEKNRILSKWAWLPEERTRPIHLTIEEMAWLKKHPTLKVQNLGTLPPFNFMENGVPQGFSVDYVKLMGKYMGVGVEFISKITWGESLAMLKEGSLDLIPHIAVNEERKKFVGYTSFIHIEYTIGMATRKDMNVHEMDDLKDKVIAVANKTFIHSHVRKNFPNQNLLLVGSTSAAVQAVSDGRADVVIGSLPTLRYYIQKNWLSNIKTAEIEGLGLARKTALPMGVLKENRTLLSILEKVNAAIPPSEVLRLKQKWMDLMPQEEVAVSFTEGEVAYLQEKQELKVCVGSDWMPYEKMEGGELTGISSAYLDIFQKQLVVPIRSVEIQDRMVHLDDGGKRKCDFYALLGKTESREERWDFTRPYIEVPMIIATRIEVPFIDNLSSVTNKKIGIVKGNAYADILKKKYPKIELVEVDNTKQGLRKLERDQLFGFIGTLHAVVHSIHKDYIGELKVGGKLEEGWKYSLATRKDEPQLHAIMGKILYSISPQNHEDILKQWISIRIQRSIDYSKLFYISLFFCLVIIFVLYKNRSMARVNKELSFAHQEIREQQEMVNKYVLMVETDLQGVIVDANDAFCRVLGYEKEELIGHTNGVMKHPKMDDKFFTEMWRSIKVNNSWSGEMMNYTKDKEVKYLNVYIDSIVKDNVKVGYRAIYDDISDKKRIEELSITDKLTAIYNRSKLDEILMRQIEDHKRYGLPFSIILLDVDNFKKVNDTFGHDIGDKVLKKVANILKNNTRATDVVGRWGGEEFLIICSNTIAVNTYTVAENLRVQLEHERFAPVERVTVSLGVAEYRENDTLDTIFKKADQALYQAKESGKNRTIISE